MRNSGVDGQYPHFYESYVAEFIALMRQGRLRFLTEGYTTCIFACLLVDDHFTL